MTTTVLDREELTARVREYARADLVLERLRLTLETGIDRIRARFASGILTQQKVVEQLYRDLQSDCDLNRPALCRGRAKSLKTLFGVIGWKTRQEKLHLRKGMDEEEAARILRRRGHEGLVREKLVLNKDAIKQARADDELSATDLKAARLFIEPGLDQFYCKPNKEAVANTLED